MSKADAFQAWCREQTQSTLAPQFLYDEEHRVTGIVKRVSLSLVPVYEALRQIESPVLPRILEICEQEGALLITEEYIEGKSLRYVLDEEGAQEDAFVIRAAKDILEALSILHNRIPPIIHRDIKPENIILRDNGRFVLIDFDAARGYSEAAQTDTVNLGTHGYAAPEQYGFAQTDARADIYSLGVLLYELRMGQPYRLGAVCDGLLAKIIRKCTQFEAKNRYQSAKEANVAMSKIGKENRRMVRALAAGAIGVAAFCAIFFLLYKPNTPATVHNAEAAIPQNSPETLPSEAPQDSPVVAPVAANVETIPCTCTLEHPLTPEERTRYLPENTITLPHGEILVKTLEVRPIRNADNCKAEVHDEPEYKFSFQQYEPPEEQEELKSTVGADIVQGNQITISAPGKYYVWFETSYHGEGFRAGYSFWVNDAP